MKFVRSAIPLFMDTIHSFVTTYLPSSFSASSSLDLALSSLCLPLLPYQALVVSAHADYDMVFS